ncbi:hypothetical protein Bca4012_087802 [Brassica carinata]
MLPQIIRSPIESNHPFTLTRRQFPIRICYAMTSHYAQGHQDFRHEQKWEREKDDSQHCVQRGLQLPATINQYDIYYLQLSV